MDTRWRKAFEKVKKVKKVGKQSLTKRVIGKSLVERGKKVFTMKKKIFCFVLVLLLMTQLTPSVTAATQGWQLDENQQWTYLENNVKVVGWQRINQKWYYFDSNGIMRTGWQIINQKWYFFANSGEMVTGWLLWNQNWYHLAPSGEMVINWQRIQNQWYYFDYESNRFEIYEKIPTLTKNFAGIGTRDINDNGVKAIVSLFKNIK